jgi:integrase/recombinase XerD
MKSDKPILELISDFVSELDVKPYVRKNQTWVLHRFVNWLTQNKIDVRNPRRADIIHYKNSLLTEGKTPCTVNTYLAPVRNFFGWLENSGIFENIAAGIRSPKDSRDFRKDYLKPEQVRQLLDLIPTDSLTGKRDFAMINLMLVYGLRRIEILRLKISDLKAESIGPVLYIQRKGREYKEPLLLVDEVFEPIQEYLTSRVNYLESDPLFGNHSRHPRNTISETMVSKILKKYLKQINDSKKLTCHSIRHSTAINLLKAGKSIYDVKELLGHSSVQTTELYLKAIGAETRFNNPLAREVSNLYRKPIKPAKNGQI